MKQLLFIIYILSFHFSIAQVEIQKGLLSVDTSKIQMRTNPNKIKVPSKKKKSKENIQNKIDEEKAPRYKNEIINEISNQMILIEGGEFIMGCNHCNDKDNKPEHTVHLNNFQISKYEITVKQFQEFVSMTNYKTTVEQENGGFISQKNGWEKKNGYSWRTDAKGHVRTLSTINEPVIFISWEDAKAFCEWLSKETHRIFRLPSEAEWEYAARGGQKSSGQNYSGGGILEQVAWYNENSGGNIHLVGSLKPNELGLYDLSGNVWEWCEDWYHKEYYKKSPNNNPRGPIKNSKQKVLRGGSWASDSQQLLIHSRYSAYPKVGAYSIGFRIVADSE